MIRRRQSIVLALILFLTICAWTIFRLPSSTPQVEVEDKDTSDRQFEEQERARRRRRPPADKRPIAAASTTTHPIRDLISEAEVEFKEARSRQSKTLAEAIKEYKRRHGIPPPPHFDKWYEFAKANKVQFIDDYDMIMDMITPFWGLKPGTIRARAREALGHDNQLVMMLIRNNNVTHVQGAHEWQREATKGMVAKFIDYLPDMDLAFNIHDEPRVVVPHDDLARLLQTARDVNMAKLSAATNPENGFTRKARDLGPGGGMREVKTTRFNVFAHQPTWTHSRMSCPPESPARILDDEDRFDDVSKYGVSDLGFVYNISAMTDVCLSPSLSETHGFFDRPNAYNIVHDLVPIFSQSKVSSYNDILYPSPWYWAEKVEYDEAKDVGWDQKSDVLYWRGSTTGGYSREGGWRRHHRQNVVKKLNAKGRALIYANEGDDANPQWKAKEVLRGDHKDAVDVHFSYVGQCDQGDCEAQIQYFDLRTHADMQDAWKNKYLLDMDGNAFSGRFYAFLRSRSLTFKYAIFREWHFEWIKPWVHYVPLSLQGEDWLEAVRYFSGGDGEAGSKEGAKIATASREWAGKVLRKEDMEVWFFRLLLEYARVIDDNRENLGYSLV